MVAPLSDAVSLLLGPGLGHAGAAILVIAVLVPVLRSSVGSVPDRVQGRMVDLAELGRGLADAVYGRRETASDRVHRRRARSRGQVLPDSLPLLLFIAGILVTAAEAIIPGAHFIVIGVALTIAGLLGLLFAPLATPLALAAMTLLFGAAAFYVYREFDFYEGQDTGSPKDSGDLKGKYGTVTQRVTASSGEVKLQGGGFNPYYRARSLDEEIPEGTEVIVIDPGGGNVVTVTPVGAIEDDIDQELAADRERRERETETDT